MENMSEMMIVSDVPPRTGAETAGDLYALALDALNRGFKVLPLLPRTKLPAARLVPNGCANATNSESVVRQWWAEYPAMNVGVSGGVIVDIDAGVDSLEAALRWAKSMGLPETLAIRTGRRSSYGLQLHFAGSTPNGPFSLGGVSGEIRCQNQYGLFAGSVHPTGNTYEIAVDLPRAEWPSGLPLEVPRTKPKAKGFIKTGPAPSMWDTRPEISIDDCLTAAGYELLGGGKAKCPTCGHRSVNIDYQKRVYFCFGCHKGNHVGALARLQGKRLA